MSALSQLVLVRAGGQFFIHSTEGDDVPDLTIPVPQDLEDPAAEVVLRCNSHDALVSAIDHPALRDLFASIEDSGTPEARRLWCLCMQWFDVRDAALSAAQDRTA